MSFIDEKFPLRRTLLGLAALAVLAVVFPTVFRIIFSARDEVSWAAGVTSSTCTGMFAEQSRHPENCLTIFEISVGNTGVNAQPLVEINLSGLPEPWRWNSDVVDIIASAKRRGSPQVNLAMQNGELAFYITGLEPNRLVDVRLSYLGPQVLGPLASAYVKVMATGAVINSNPHLTVVARLLRNVLGIF